MRWAAKAMSSRRLGTDLSYHKELMLYLGKSIATRDGLSLILGVEYPAIAVTYTDTDKVFVLDKVMHSLHLGKSTATRDGSSLLLGVLEYLVIATT